MPVDVRTELHLESAGGKWGHFFPVLIFLLMWKDFYQQKFLVSLHSHPFLSRSTHSALFLHILSFSRAGAHIQKLEIAQHRAQEVSLILSFNINMATCLQNKSHFSVSASLIIKVKFWFLVCFIFPVLLKIGLKHRHDEGGFWLLP